jgi:hypothetical protein
MASLMFMPLCVLMGEEEKSGLKPSRHNVNMGVMVKQAACLTIFSLKMRNC